METLSHIADQVVKVGLHSTDIHEATDDFGSVQASEFSSINNLESVPDFQF